MSSSQKFHIILTRLGRYFQKLDRIGWVWYGIVAFALILLSASFSFTVINHDYYKAAADRQQKRIEKNPVSRGSIYSSEASLRGVAAISTNLGTLAIDPSQSGSVTRLLDFLSEAVYFEYCGQHTLEECANYIGVYTRTDLSQEKDLNSALLKEKIKAYLRTRIDTPIESVLVKENLDDASVEQINRINDDALFFVVNNLYVNPTKVHNAESLAATLSPVLNMSTEEIVPKFAIRPKRYLEIIRKMNIGTRDMVNKFLENNRNTTLQYIEEAYKKTTSTEEKSIVRAEIIQEYAVYPFITIQDNLVRYYPEGSAMGQITGFVDNEGVGRYGIEGYYEHELQGESPVQVITKDIRGGTIRDYTSSGSLTLKSGVDISLTIDRSIQKEIASILESSVKKFRANRASVIVMDPKTGAIIAMVNYPDYDPNNFTEVYEMEPVLYETYPNPSWDLFGFPLFVIDSASGSISSNIDGKRVKLREANDMEIGNFAIQKFKFKNGYGVGNYKNDVVSALYEPGSVFKPITVAIGIDTGEIKPTDTYYDRNYVELNTGGAVQRINNVARTNCGGYHTYSNALNWSCNVGMINIIEKIGRSLFDKYIRDFGFGSKSNLAIDGEVFSQIAAYDRWSRMQFFTMSFGQGISVNMVQMAAAYTALANGGVYMQPYVVESMTYPDGKKIDTVPTPVRRVIKEETSKTITAMLVEGAKIGFAVSG